MLSGFNTNIRHRGVLFHVQSEDSGRAHPHIITHLYHGGTILFSEKSGYDASLDQGLDERVRKQMEGQHKAVLKRLVAGEFDAAVRERLGDVFDDAVDTKAEVRASGTEPVVSLEPEPTGETESAASRSFGESVVSDKPLDEVILNYLVESARKRRQKSSS
jgi:hypothetical protein